MTGVCAGLRGKLERRGVCEHTELRVGTAYQPVDLSIYTKYFSVCTPSWLSTRVGDFSLCDLVCRCKERRRNCKCAV